MSAPKEVRHETCRTNSDWPETRDELIARFCEPDHNGVTLIEDRALFERFVDAALSRPDPTYSRTETRVPMSPSTLCHRIHDRGLFFSADTGWVDREGNFWPCGFASHERLLEHMGMNSIEQELEGWIKLSRRRAHAVYAPNLAQIATLMRIIEGVEKLNEGDAAGAMPGANIDLAALRDLPQLRASPASQRPGELIP